MSLPSAVRFVVIGAGVHGLSTAWHLAQELKARRLGDGTQIVVLDKTGVGAGASGIACGVIRNNYFQPAMRELMAHSVGIWESDPDAFSYHPVGYLQISPEAMRADVATIYQQQRGIGYPSTFVEGAAEVRRYMQRIDVRIISHDEMHALWPQADLGDFAMFACEPRGGYGDAYQTGQVFAHARRLGVSIRQYAPVTSIILDTTGRAAGVVVGTERIHTGSIVVAAGPWSVPLFAPLGIRLPIRAQREQILLIATGEPTADPQGIFDL